MKLYNAKQAPNPKRVRVFIAEKGIEIPTDYVEIGKGTRSPAFAKINSLGLVPVLELDDGTLLSESIAICRYLEALYPDPPLFGADPKSSALIEMWCRRLELEVMRPMGDVANHSFSFFAERMEQLPAYADVQRRTASAKLAWLDREMADSAYIAGDTFSMADIVGMNIVDLIGFLEIEVPPGLDRFATWADRLRSRPSFAV